MIEQELCIEAFHAQNPHLDIQRGKYLQRWRYQYNFHRDLLRTPIQTYSEKLSIETEWTERTRMYFNDERMIPFVDSVVPAGAYLSEVMTTKEALKADASWSETFDYRVHFPRRSRPAPEELEGKGLSGETIKRRCSRFINADGTETAVWEVVAYMTSSGDAVVWLKMMYPKVVVETK